MRRGIWGALLIFVALETSSAAKPKGADYSNFAGQFQGSGGMDLTFVRPKGPLLLPLTGSIAAVSKVRPGGKRATVRVTALFNVPANPDGFGSATIIPLSMGFTLQNNRIKITEMTVAGLSMLAAPISGNAKVKSKAKSIAINGAQTVTLVPIPGFNLTGSAQMAFNGKIKVTKKKTMDFFDVVIPDIGGGVSLTIHGYFTGKKKK